MQTTKLPMTPAKAMVDSTVSRTIANQVGSMMMSTAEGDVVELAMVALLKDITDFPSKGGQS